MDFEKNKEIAMGHMKKWNRGKRVSVEVWEYIMWHYSELFLNVQSEDTAIRNTCISSLKTAFEEAKCECDEIGDQEEVKREARRRRERMRNRVANMSDEQVEAQRRRHRVENMSDDRVEA
jgi:hypothetical protein